MYFKCVQNITKWEIILLVKLATLIIFDPWQIYCTCPMQISEIITLLHTNRDKEAL